MLGRELLPEGSVAAIAALLRPDSSSANETATARREKKRDESRIAISSE
jgi:hypothetical protein